MADIVYMVRHAAPPVGRRDRYWGRADPGVDADSLAGTAALLPMFWEKPSVIFTSPLRRAAATADAIAGHFNLEPTVEPELAETDFGDFDGLSWDEISTRHSDAAAAWAREGDAFHFPNGESVPDFLDRADRVWQRITSAEDKTVLAVSHGGIIAAWCCLFLRMPLEHRFSFRPAYAALTAFIRKKDGSGWEMTFFNNTL
ncbi:MAG: histidine phosphatase family protein [Planctomycetes bacterium]|nr:histidine phosphatase family protein [Planctomycetota bacterium]